MTDTTNSQPLTVNITSWNVGGLNVNVRKYKMKDVYTQAKVKPDIIAVQEHKLDEFAVQAVGKLICRDLLTLCSPGLKGTRGDGTGGTALFIHKSFKIVETGNSPDGFHTWAKLLKDGHEFIVASVYGPHSPTTRAQQWERLRNTFPHTNLILCGDWNMVEKAVDSSGE